MVKSVLHLGAHRCATTTFQGFLDQNTATLREHQIAVWTPAVARDQIFNGLFCKPDEETSKTNAAAMNVQRKLDALCDQNVSQLIVSEENIIGSPQGNLGGSSLYPDLLPRLERFKLAFGDSVDRIGLCIRSYESYWSSLAAFSVQHGYRVPHNEDALKLANQGRTWSQLIAEIRQLFPQTSLNIWTFERFASQPRRQFTLLSGDRNVAQRLEYTAIRRNYSRDADSLRRMLRKSGRDANAQKLPKGIGAVLRFDAEQSAQMAVRYAEDLSYISQSQDSKITLNGGTRTTVIQRRASTGGHNDRHQEVG